MFSLLTRKFKAVIADIRGRQGPGEPAIRVNAKAYVDLLVCLHIAITALSRHTRFVFDVFASDSVACHNVGERWQV